MASGATYTPISSTTFGSNTTSLTFSSISSAYTDLVIVIGGIFTADISGGLTFNSDTGSNYTTTRMYGTGTAATTNSSNSGTQMAFTTGKGDTRYTFIINIMNYSSSSTYKPVLVKGAMDMASARIGTWLSTSAINSINLTANGGQFVAGTTITLYGIAAA